MKKKAFLWYMFITILFFGILIKLEYATDTYAVFNFDKDAVFMQYAMSGRFITAVVLKFIKIANFSEYVFYLSSYILAIFCAVLSQYILYKIIEKDVKSKILKLIIPTLIIINPFSIELFLFIEKGLMWLGILACVLALKNLQKFFENNKSFNISNEIDNKKIVEEKKPLCKTTLKMNKKNLLYSLIFMFLANCLYQGITGIFISVALVYILKYSKNIRKVASPYVQVALQPHESKKLNLFASEKSNDFSYAIRKVASPDAIKDFIVNNAIIGCIYAIPALTNFLLIKILFKQSRINGQIVIIKSLKIILKNTLRMATKMYELLPKYAFILLILFTFAVFCCKIWKDKKKFLHILKFVYIMAGITLAAIVPQIVQPTNSIWFVPRSTYCFASMYGILVLYIAINYDLEGFQKYSILVLCILLVFLQLQKFVKIEKDRFLLNKNDQEITMQIAEQIKKYENTTGNTITELSWYQDEKPNYTYNGIFVTCDMNVKCYSSDWSTVEILKYYLKKDIKLVKKDENLANQFKKQNWDDFNKEQIVFEQNKLNLCNY